MALLAHTLALLAMTVATVTIKVVPLDMAQESFDDRYWGCGPAMTKELPTLQRFEFQKNPLFAMTWEKAKAEWRKRGSPVSPLADPAQAVAVMANSMSDIYKDFNAATRAAGRSLQAYRNNFHFKTLHFMLNQALVTLRQAQNWQCYRVFRGVPDIHFQARQGQRVRFGHFTSTSLRKEVALRFGRVTIFEVRTCHGADIQQFSLYPREREVLIPPFEIFKVAKVIQNGQQTMISLDSAGIFSKYNCAWL